ncbi:MAG: class I tRNA ligase family protein [Phycisphaerales bacterium]|nr:class I tRNA ligase family protein [Phycisphaerales bacterium]
MAFEKVETKVDFAAQERQTLAFWDEIQAFNKLREKNAGKPRWSFLDGPITANNPMGVHHAWGRTYKDVFCRYFAATGHELRYQNGFDCQGLWVEVEVEREFDIKTKTDIEKLGLDKFTQACKDRVHKYAAIQSEQSKRLGYWMDWDNSYFTMAPENNYTIWSFLKKCHEGGFIYKGTDVMPWSGRAGCAYSHMEIAEGRRLVTHTSVFVRFPIRDRKDEYLLVWTTTPWTLTSNTGCAVNGDLDYVKLQAKRDGAIYYFAEENLQFQRLAKEYKEGFGGKPWPKDTPKLKTLHQIFQEKGGYEVLGKIKGSELVGLTYDGPFDELPAQQKRGGFAHPQELIPQDQRDWPSGAEGHRVFDPGKTSKGEAYVVAGEGTGIVHSAPGCGDVDNAWGKTQKIVAIAPLDAEGRFTEGFGPFTGKRATDRETVDAILESLREKELLVAHEEYPHIYPHCWRTGDELVFRLVDEWYISMDWRDEIKKVASQVNWLPASMRGLERELDWLTTMRDWMISKKRYWGLALPIWECPECGHFDVIGGYEELKERAVSGWEEFEGHTPHRPYVDAVKIACDKCQCQNMARIPDVGNPWLDAGIVAYSTTKYNTDREYWDKWIPADLITECFPGQFRNWFYAILAMSAMMEMGKEKPRPPFKNLLGHALVLNEERQAMHKSDGTAIWFEEAAEQLGVDTMRWMYASQTPTSDLAFGTRHPDEPITITGDDGIELSKTVGGDQICRVTSTPADETRRRVLLPLWNTYAFFCNYARLDEFDVDAALVPYADRPDIDRWILSDLQLLIRDARASFEAFDLQPVCGAVERFIENLSTWYIRRNRRRFWRGPEAGDTDKLAAYQTLYEVLVTLNKVIAPILPFITEQIHQNLVAKQSPSEPLSVHLCDYPEPNETLIDNALSDKMAALLRIVSLARSARASSKLKVRQPLAGVLVKPANDIEREAVEHAEFRGHILEELNVKNVEARASVDELISRNVEVNKKTAGKKFGKDLPGIIKAIGDMDGQAISGSLAKSGTVEVSVGGGVFTLDTSDVIVAHDAGDDWSVAVDGETVILIDRRLSTELIQEGLARDLVRNIQNLRKDSGLNIEDRIALSIVTEDKELQAAVSAFEQYIKDETLAVELVQTPPDNADSHSSTVKIADTTACLSIAPQAVSA